MNSIFLTGSSGFVGVNLIEYFESSKLYKYQRETPLEIYHDVVIHLAGKAHDLIKISKPDEYYQVNTELTKKVYNAFLVSGAKVFITLSSVKAVADEINGELSEENIPNPITHYGKSKLLADQYILSQTIPEGKRVYILRPCMIHGPGNKGNLNLLYNLVSKGMPWPLGAFENKRSFCNIDNLMFIIKELIDREDIPSGVYNIADDKALSTNDIIGLIARSQFKSCYIWNIPKFIINTIAKMGDLLQFPLNSERLQKLTETYIVSNKKIKYVINKDLPFSTEEGLLKTFNSFNKNV
jgi:nucleoside-diphosphate-sugar epimerase